MLKPGSLIQICSRQTSPTKSMAAGIGYQSYKQKVLSCRYAPVSYPKASFPKGIMMLIHQRTVRNTFTETRKADHLSTGFIVLVYVESSSPPSSGFGIPEPNLLPLPSQFLITQGALSGPWQIFFLPRFLNLGP